MPSACTKFDRVLTSSAAPVAMLSLRLPATMIQIRTKPVKPSIHGAIRPIASGSVFPLGTSRYPSKEGYAVGLGRGDRSTIHDKVCPCARIRLC